MAHGWLVLQQHDASVLRHAACPCPCLLPLPASPLPACLSAPLRWCGAAARRRSGWPVPPLPTHQGGCWRRCAGSAGRQSPPQRLRLPHLLPSQRRQGRRRRRQSLPPAFSGPPAQHSAPLRHAPPTCAHTARARPAPPHHNNPRPPHIGSRPHNSLGGRLARPCCSTCSGLVCIQRSPACSLGEFQRSQSAIDQALAQPPLRNRFCKSPAVARGKQFCKKCWAGSLPATLSGRNTPGALVCNNCGCEGHIPAFPPLRHTKPNPRQAPGAQQEAVGVAGQQCRDAEPRHQLLGAAGAPGRPAISDQADGGVPGAAARPGAGPAATAHRGSMGHGESLPLMPQLAGWPA